MAQIRVRGGFSVALLSAIIGLVAPAAAPAAAPGAAVPTPAAASQFGGQLDWEIDFKPGDLRLYVDPADGRYYWYFTYTVTNRTERDIVFAPRIELFFDSGEILRSGRGVSTRVVDQLKRLLGDPLLEDQNRIIGDLRVGRENARTGIAVWPAEDQEVTEITLFFQGLSSDRVDVAHPVTGKKVPLYRTLRREYIVPGDPEARGSTPLALAERSNRRGPDCESEFQVAGRPAGCWIYR